MIHAWYSTQHMLKSGDVVYEGLNGKPVAVTFVCSSKERGDEWVKRSLFDDYKYIGMVSNSLIS